MLSMVEEEKSIDFFTLREELRRRNKEDAADGPAYVASLTDGLPRAMNVGHYAKTVRPTGYMDAMLQALCEQGKGLQAVRWASRVIRRLSVFEVIAAGDLGDRGYTLILDSGGTHLAEHHHCESVQEALARGADIIPKMEQVQRFPEQRRARA